MRKSGYFPLANQINWSSQAITSWKKIFVYFYWFPHLTWNGGIFSTSWKWIFVYFFIISPSGGRFSKIEALNQLDLEMIFCLFFPMLSNIPRKNIHNVYNFYCCCFGQTEKLKLLTCQSQFLKSLDWKYYNGRTENECM